MTSKYLCDVEKLDVGTMARFDVEGEAILLYRLADGFFATQAKCTHLFMPLEKGKILGGCRIQCKFHHAEFDIKTGKVCNWASFPPGIQALNFLRGEKDLKTFSVKVESGKVYLG